MDESDIAY